MTNYHTRAEREELLAYICRQTGKPMPRTHKMSNWDLMTVINTKLIDNGCVPLTEIELKPYQLK